MVRVGRSGCRVQLEPPELERMRAQYRDRHFVSLPRILEKSLLDPLLDLLDAASYAEGTVNQYTCAENLADPMIDGRISFVFNDPVLFGFVQAVTGCGEITEFSGRVLRLVPGRGHYVKWHYDLDNAVIRSRRAALRVNLSRRSYRGCSLQFRRPDSETIVSEYADTACGNAVLFNPKDVLHGCSELEGSEPRVAFTGSFHFSGRNAFLGQPRNA